MKKSVKASLIVILSGLIVWVMAPAFLIGGKGIAIIAPVIVFTALLFVVVFWERIAAMKSKRAKVIKYSLSGIAVVCAVGVLGTMVAMCGASVQKPQTNDATVIILGCRVNGTYPSLMLRRRIDHATEYLKKNQDAKCVVTGGQGDYEDISEAQAEKERLIKNGIDASRIYIEDQSMNTLQNINNAAKIIKENNLSTNVAISTDDFHQLRSHMIAKKAGLSAASISSPTPLDLLLYYWSREIFALANYMVLS